MMKNALGYQVILAILLGIAAGLLFGPYCSVLTPIGEIFFMLVQMAVLPYLLFLLVHGLGSLSIDVAKKLFSRGWFFFLSLWIVGLFVVYSLSRLIPTPELVFVEPSGGGAETITMNLISYLIPKNVFYDLANNIIPAVTVCGVIGGLALMSITKKQYVLNVLEEANTSIEKIFEWLAIASPVAIFSHLAVSTGTIGPHNLVKFQISIGIYIFGILFLTFWLLPVLLTSLTGLSYREVMKEFKSVCLIPFATGMPSLAFPFMYVAIKRLGQRNEIDSQHFRNTAQTILPLSFTFGQLGNFFMLFFIYFISFYTHHPLTSVQEFLVMILLLPLSFGNIFTSFSSISFLIDKLNFPSQAYQVFLTTSAITTNFQVLLSAASILTLVILVLSAYYGLLKVKWTKLILNTVAALGTFILLLFVSKPLLQFEDNFTYLYPSLKVTEVISKPAEATIYQEGDLIPHPDYPTLHAMQRVLKSGVLRVGYFPMDTPFSYFNRFAELSGYDVSFAYKLASDLDCYLEFIPIDPMRIGEQLAAAEYDVAMSGLVMSEQRLTQMDFVKPTFEQNSVLIVPVERKADFLNLDTVMAMKGLKIGGIGAYYQSLSKHFPRATPIPLENFKSLQDKQVDAVIWNYLSAFVWCLSNPNFTIIDYDGRIGKSFFSYAVATGEGEWMHFLQNWLMLKDESGFSTEMYNYWILGQMPIESNSRWPIVRHLMQ